MVRSANNDLQIIHEVKPGGFSSNFWEFASLFVCIFGVACAKPPVVYFFFASPCISLNQFRDIVLFGTYIFPSLRMLSTYATCPADGQPVSCHHLQRCFAKLYRHWSAPIHFNYLSQVAQKSRSSDKNPPPLYSIRSYSITSCQSITRLPF